MKKHIISYLAFLVLVVAPIYVFCSTWPVKDTGGSDRVEVNSTFGIRTYNDGDWHDGVDIQMDSGDYAVSCVNGLVVNAGVHTGFDYCFVIKDASNDYHYFCHLQSDANSPSVGTAVAEGDYLGESAAGHLHYMYLPGQLVDGFMFPRLSIMAHPFRMIPDMNYSGGVTGYLGWDDTHDPVLECYYNILDGSYRLNGFTVTRLDEYGMILNYYTDSPSQINCCSNADGNYEIVTGVHFYPENFPEGATPTDNQYKSYYVQWACGWHQTYQLCLCEEPSSSPDCLDPVANEEVPEIHAEIHGGVARIEIDNRTSEYALERVDYSSSDYSVIREVAPKLMPGETDVYTIDADAGALQHDFRYYITDDGGKHYLEIVSHVIVDMPVKQGSLRAYPNPFNGQTKIRLTFSEKERRYSKTLDVYDIAGRRVASLEGRSVGIRVVEYDWEARDRSERALPSGIYYASLRYCPWVQNARLVYIK